MTMERSEPQMGVGGQVADGTTEHTSVKHPKVTSSYPCSFPGELRPG